MSTDYRVDLGLYSGPLDLLLYLVRRNEVDVVDLPIATITAQFLEYLEVLEFIDLDLAGDFLVAASALMEVKSRLVLPQAEDEEVELELDEEPHGELIKQLLEYRRFRDAARALEEHAAEWQLRYPRLNDDRPKLGKDPSQDRIKEVELWDLVSALARVLRRKDVSEETLIRYDDTPISVYIERIGSEVRKVGRVAFSSFFQGTNERSKIVGIFLAILELLRHHSFRADQPVDCGDIWVLPPLEEVGAKSSESSLSIAATADDDTRPSPEAGDESDDRPADESDAA